ncbi:ABC transporter ATP-binding protein [Peterkaempfera bronchialis]|uniref:ABC transporter ATP-binding protein n=1 Tax=Peterkaempfera bronchialis TaxID=2126346 RepID=A0A345T6V5_9ACTN|nr:ABC transporter ATP-binding protein [Peterkaempfera bronchialis]AXI81710.1 ABC transporter ATP-binding protein [Peterkaempfera bronchialis]
MLRVEKLCAGYGEVPVLDGVDLSVDRGETVVVVGPNGHGKTTLVRAVSGLVVPTSGRITFEGADITGRRAEVIARLGIRHIPQGDLLFPDMSVLENLLMGGFLCPSRQDRDQRLARVFEIFPKLYQRREQRSRTLSGGERRMLAIGRGLMAEARLLIIDEPSLGLAPVIVDEVYARIGRIAESGIAILLVEENFGHIKDLADRVCLVETGRIIREGSTAELMSDQALVRTYLGVETGQEDVR